MLAMMLDSDFKRLGLFIQYVGKEITLQITSEYDWHVLIPLLVHVFKFLNPSVANERTFNVTLKSIEATLLYDIMEAKKEMALSMVKKIESFIIKKVNEEECNDLHGTKIMKCNFLMLGFVAKQILRIVGS
jgi:hypothetical protein